MLAGYADVSSASRMIRLSTQLKLTPEGHRISTTARLDGDPTDVDADAATGRPARGDVAAVRCRGVAHDGVDVLARALAVDAGVPAACTDLASVGKQVAAGDIDRTACLVVAGSANVSTTADEASVTL